MPNQVRTKTNDFWGAFDQRLTHIDENYVKDNV